MNRSYTSSIVIPIYKNWKLCHALLNDLRRFDNAKIDEIIIVDDCSEDPEVEGGLEFWIDSKLLPIRVVKNEINSGFTISANNGLKQADRPPTTKHITFLISSDARISGYFVDQTADILFGARKSLVGNRLISFDSGWNTFDGVTFEYLEGFFLACTSDGWRELGYFDQNYAPFDMEDIDLSTTAKQKGFKLQTLNSPIIQHRGGGTIGYNPTREAITIRNKEYFRNKWIK